MKSMPDYYGLRLCEISAAIAAGAAAGATGLWLLHPVAAMAAGYMVFSVLMIVVIDSRHFIIPDIFSLPAIPLGLATVPFVPDPGFGGLAGHVAAAGLAAAALYLLARFYRKARGIEGLGLGDVKLAAAAGSWTGLDGLPMVLLLASGAALLAVLLRNRVIRGDRASLMTPVPFGSFLAPAILIVWCFGLSGPY